MKTIKLTRTIRREVDGVFVYIGPKGIGFRDKHRPKRETFELTWKQLFACAEEERSLKSLVEVKPVISVDPKQMPMFPIESPFPIVHTPEEAMEHLKAGGGGIGVDLSHLSREEALKESERLSELHMEITSKQRRRSAWISPPPPQDIVFDEGVNCEDVPKCDQEFPQSPGPEPDDGTCFVYLNRIGAPDPEEAAGLDMVAETEEDESITS